MHLPPYPQPKGPEEKRLALLNEVILENHRGLCITLYKTNDKDILPGFILNQENLENLENRPLLQKVRENLE